MEINNELFKNKYRVKTCRYEGYDYSREGYYFITICTKHREMFFGDVVDGKMRLSEIGKIAKNCCLEIPDHFPFVQLDEYVVMPNHVHGILVIEYNINVETQNFASLRGYKNKFGPQSKNLSSIIRGFKIGVKKYTIMEGVNFAWQERFYDRIIRNEKELNKIRQYIIDNPEKCLPAISLSASGDWQAGELDRNNPINF